MHRCLRNAIAFLSAFVLTAVVGLAAADAAHIRAVARAVAARTVANPALLPAQAVLPMSDVLGERYCSVVVVAPGVALTAKHCNVGGLKAFVEQAGVQRPIEAWHEDTEQDLATILVPGLLCPCAPVGTPDMVMTGEDVFVLGYPRGSVQAITFGFIIGRLELNRDIGAGTGTYIAITAPVEGGNSGGGVFVVRNSVAYLIGITSWMVGSPRVTGAVEVTRPAPERGGAS